MLGKDDIQPRLTMELSPVGKVPVSNSLRLIKIKNNKKKVYLVINKPMKRRKHFKINNLVIFMEVKRKINNH